MICLTYGQLVVIGLVYVASGALSAFVKGFIRGWKRHSPEVTP